MYACTYSLINYDLCIVGYIICMTVVVVYIHSISSHKEVLHKAVSLFATRLQEDN